MSQPDINPNFCEFTQTYFRQKNSEKQTYRSRVQSQTNRTVQLDESFQSAKGQETYQKINTNKVLNKMQEDFQKLAPYFRIKDYTKKLPPKEPDYSEYFRYFGTPQKIQPKQCLPMNYTQMMMSQTKNILDKSKFIHLKIENFLEGLSKEQSYKQELQPQSELVVTKRANSLYLKKKKSSQNQSNIQQLTNQDIEIQPQQVTDENNHLIKRPLSEFQSGRTPLNQYKYNPLHKLIGQYEDLLMSDYASLGKEMKEIIDTHRIHLSIERKSQQTKYRQSQHQRNLNGEKTYIRTIRTSLAASKVFSKSKTTTKRQFKSLEQQQTRPQTANIIEKINHLKEKLNYQINSVDKKKKSIQRQYARSQKNMVETKPGIDHFRQFFDDERTLQWVQETMIDRDLEQIM